MAAAQEVMKRNADRHLREANFQVGDKVYLDTHHWKTERPSQKLDNPYAGPFTITSKVGESYRVNLPVTMRIHNVFPPNKLRKDSGTPLPG